MPSSQTAGDGVPAAFEGLVAAVQEALTPVRPAPAFRKGLARDLAALARQKRSPRIILHRPPDYRRGLLIGAAVSSAVSVAGLIAIIWHHRAHQMAQPTL
jgi:hypothetical protein